MESSTSGTAPSIVTAEEQAQCCIHLGLHRGNTTAAQAVRNQEVTCIHKAAKFSAAIGFPVLSKKENEMKKKKKKTRSVEMYKPLDNQYWSTPPPIYSP